MAFKRPEKRAKPADGTPRKGKTTTDKSKTSKVDSKKSAAPVGKGPKGKDFKGKDPKGKPSFTDKRKSEDQAPSSDRRGSQRSSKAMPRLMKKKALPEREGPLFYFLLYKPFQVLSQFTKEVPDHKVLGDVFPFPTDVYPVGRLDQDSEGLLLLTNDSKLNHQLLSPALGHKKTYYVQVEGAPSQEDLAPLAQGVTLTIKGKPHKTAPAIVTLLPERPKLPEREPPVRMRKTVPDTWVSVTITEGKNRQIRKMMAAVGFPVLRLVRYSIEQFTIKDMAPGDVREIDSKVLFRGLRLD